MTDIATLQARLDEAETAYHKLLTGSLAESIGNGNHLVRYTAGNAAALVGYIDRLKSEIAAAGGNAGTRRKAITVDL